MQEAARHALAMAEQHRMQASGTHPPQDGEFIPASAVSHLQCSPACLRIGLFSMASCWAPAIQQAPA